MNLLLILLLAFPGTTAVVAASGLALFVKDATIERLVPRLIDGPPCSRSFYWRPAWQPCDF